MTQTKIIVGLTGLNHGTSGSALTGNGMKLKGNFNIVIERNHWFSCKYRYTKQGEKMECRCKECNQRTATCHAECEHYKAWSAERQAFLKRKQIQTIDIPIPHETQRKYWKNLRQGVRRK